MSAKAKPLQRRVGDAHNRLIDKVIAAARKSRRDFPDIDLSLFTREYFRGVSAEDLRERRIDDLAGAALSHLKFMRKRKSGAIRVRVFNPDKRKDGWTARGTVVQMVNDDMPFLVDTLGMVLNRENHPVQLTAHPILRVERRRGGELSKVFGARDTTVGNRIESVVMMEFERIADAEEIRELETLITSAMRDVRRATSDWMAMQGKVREICLELEHTPPPIPTQDTLEGKALLEWMTDDNFTFLGYREYKLVNENGEDKLTAVADTGLGILKDNPISSHTQPSDTLARAIRKQARSKELIIITKANSPSTVHRPGYLDYIGVKTFGADGRANGERRFLGLFTSVAYSRSPREIPLLRHKVAQVMKRSDLAPKSHGAKALMHILETYPRDELFQISVQDLARISTGILSLQERQRVKLFVRRDAFRRFFSCLVFVPREKYHTRVRTEIEKILRATLNGISAESDVQLSNSRLARVLFIIRTSPNASSRLSLKGVEQQMIDVVRTWQDKLRDALCDRFGLDDGVALSDRYAACFPAAYQEDVSPRAASFDIEMIAALGDADDDLQMSLYRPPSFSEQHVRFKLFKRTEPISISDALPMLENMGLRVVSERPYRVTLKDQSVVWIQDFEMIYDEATSLDLQNASKRFQETFASTWRGQAESDGFNRLVLKAGLSWRETSVLRAYARYLLQTGLPFSQQYMEEVLHSNETAAALMIERFALRFDPKISARKRNAADERLKGELEATIEAVVSADHDRILRAFRTVMDATLRTNIFQTGDDGALRSCMSFKLDPTRIPDLPLPRPMFEVFVYSPRMEGVHLRGGRIARGGIRWSDRREDFRTEVLGLMKAQKVKNTLIVPTGAKGGFVCKQLPEGSRDEIMDEVITCYKSFISGLLDITDNLVAGKVIPPADVVRYDSDDPYLVVAADKGTATFSDTANGLAAGYGFWLDDAFASGGSAGYDHKGMGITAKGAWEAVRRHFREMSVDVQTQPFTVCGLGDMSGDVFGNGMLRSPFIKLRAAFNHMHIFLDPDGDCEAGFKERERLFALPRSSWQDYNPALISSGGGVFSRQDKRIAISAEVRAMLDLDNDVQSLRPTELIKAILRMPVDLIWNGGIGTYIKASTETHLDVGDRANDSVRVNAKDLRCKVIGEGGNLGLTQLGRVEFALNGGRVNTDFIDNSGGVDCSDREVNIKILLNVAVANGTLNRVRRNKLLASMTDEVDRLVLNSNYLQTQAISLMEAVASERAREIAHLVRSLERHNELNRGLEFLPDDEAIQERFKAGTGFTRPELAIILSYSKISVFDELVKSDVADDPYLAGELARYFPAPLQRRFSELMPQHQLRREIIATQVTNSIINRMGPTFMRRTQEETGATGAEIARAYTIAREAFDMRSVWKDVEDLDNKIHARSQYSMLQQTVRLLRRTTLWLLVHRPESLSIAAAVERFQPGVRVVAKRLPRLLVASELEHFKDFAEIYEQSGVPVRLARRIAGLGSMYGTMDIVDVAHRRRMDVAHVANVYFRLGAGLNLIWLSDQVEGLSVSGHWQAMARGTLRDNLFHSQRDLTALVLKRYPDSTPERAVAEWLEFHGERIARGQKMLKEMRLEGAQDFSALSVAIQEVRNLTQV